MTPDAVRAILAAERDALRSIAQALHDALRTHRRMGGALDDAGAQGLVVARGYVDEAAGALQRALEQLERMGHDPA